MVAGALGGGGYYMGERLYPAREANPKGFFEDPEINGINEALLAQVVPTRHWALPGNLFRSRLGRGQLWLSMVPVGTEIRCPPRIARRIMEQTAKAPFCFKDPRFSYTLPAWRPFLKDAAFVCIFREPGRTAYSILKECRDAPYLHDLPMDFDKAVSVWTLMYRQILEVHRHAGDWLFVHFDQILDGSAIARLETVLRTEVDAQFSDPALKRSPNDSDAGPEALRVYGRLCELAGYPGRPAAANRGTPPLIP